MTGIDPQTLRGLFMLRLHEIIGDLARISDLTATALADILLAVTAEAGLIAMSTAPWRPADDHTALAVIVVAETLRINSPRTDSFVILANTVVDALWANGIACTPPPPVSGVKLSPRRTQVLALYASGLTYEEVGKRLGISRQTVASHLDKIRQLLGASNTANAVMIAQQMGLVGTAAIPTQRLSAA